MESPSLKKIGMRAQLTELTEKTLFLRILGPSGLAQGHHGPNSYIFLIAGIRPILLAIRRIMLKFFCTSQIPVSQAVWVKAILLLSKTHLMKLKFITLEYNNRNRNFTHFPSLLCSHCVSCIWHLGRHADISWNWSLLPLNTISWPEIIVISPDIPFFAAIVWAAFCVLLTFRWTCWHIMYLITN